MLQHWANEGEFYIGNLVLRQFIGWLCLHVARLYALHKKKYHIGKIFRYSRNIQNILKQCMARNIYILLYTVNPVIYTVILFMRIMRVVVRVHKQELAKINDFTQ